MLIELTCSCGKRLQVSVDFAGRQGQCPACGGRVQSPKCDGTVTSVASSSDEAAQAVSAAPRLAGPKGPSAPKDAVTPRGGSAADLHNTERGGPVEDDKGKLTAVGCVLTLLTTAVIFGVALSIVQWRNPETGQPLPRMVAILAPILIGAVFHGIGTGFLRLLGLRTWSKSERDASGGGKCAFKIMRR
jgi:hypothetical protein